MDFYELIRARHSIRKYKTKSVPEEKLQRIMEAARIAPSAANFQPWHFFVVRDAQTRKNLFSEPRQAWISQAPVAIVACSYPAHAWVRKADAKNHADVDLAIAMEHIVLAATEEGLGSCWICAFDPATVRQALRLPAEIEPVAITPIGYADSEPEATPRKALEDIVTWR